MTLDVGDIATLDYSLTVSGVPTDATVVLTVTAPDGTSSSPSVTHPGVGSYRGDVPLTQAGIWSYTWTASGEATDVETGAFLVGDAGIGVALLPAFEARLGRTLVDPDRARAIACLDDAVGLAQAVATIPTVWPLRVTAVVLAAARRGFQNPDGLQSETIASYAYSRAGDATGGVYLTEGERRIIRQACRATGTAVVDTSRRLRARLGDAVLNDRYGSDYEYWQFNEFGQRY